MQIICLEKPAFYALVYQVVNYIKTKHEIKEENWISAEGTMKLLHINSRTTLQKFRDDGHIRFFQADCKIILYDRDSINEYLDKNAKDTF